jgi:adenosylcobinamide-GDP ribazoletransferase
MGSGKPAEPALQIMKRSDIGPFGVVTLVLTLLIQVAALNEMPVTGGLALITACVTGRLAVTWACREGVPSARSDGLGALVAGTVRRGAAIAATLAAAVVVALLALVVMTASWPASGHPPTALRGLAPSILVCPIAIAAGLGAAAWLRRRAERRLGGITGDVLGALVETATTVALLVCALVLP